MPFYHHPPQNLSHISPISATTNKTKQVSANPRFTLFSITHHQLIALLRVCFVSVCLSSVWSSVGLLLLSPSLWACKIRTEARKRNCVLHPQQCKNTLFLANDFVLSANERRATESSWGQQSSCGRTEFRERRKTTFLRTNRVPRTKENSVPEDEQSSGNEEQQSSCGRIEFWNYRRWKTEREFLFAQLWAKDVGKSVVLLGTFRETHWELVRNMRRTPGTYWKRHWEQNENRMGTTKSKKMRTPRQQLWVWLGSWTRPD